VSREIEKPAALFFAGNKHLALFPALCYFHSPSKFLEAVWASSSFLELPVDYVFSKLPLSENFSQLFPARGPFERGPGKLEPEVSFRAVS